MAAVRITGSWRRPHKMRWAGTPRIHADGRIDRSARIPEEAYRAIEHELAKGAVQGVVALPGGARFDWFLHGALRRRTNAAARLEDPP